jgi:hypothetical protein
MANEFKVKNGIKFPDNSIQTTVKYLISNKTSAYTVVADDLGKVINCTSGTFTIALTAAATLGAGFYCWIWNSGTGIVTVETKSSENIDGISLTFVLYPEEGIQLVSTGSNWETASKKVMTFFAQAGTNLGRAVASGTAATAIGPVANATGADSLALGNTANATNSYTTAIGRSAYATGSSSISINNFYGNFNNSASGTASLVIGSANTSSATLSASWGYQALSNIIGKLSRATGSFGDTNSEGSAQSGHFILRAASSGNTAIKLTTNGQTFSSNNQIILPETSAIAFTGTIIARGEGTLTSFAAWEIKGALYRDSGVNTTVLGSYNINTLSKSAGASDWTVTLSADTTNGGLSISVAGDAFSTNIRWVASIQTTEVIFPVYVPPEGGGGGA